MARAQLIKITQGTHSVHKYSNKFNEVSIRTGFNEQALVDQYYEGLD